MSDSYPTYYLLPKKANKAQTMIDEGVRRRSVSVSEILVGEIRELISIQADTTRPTFLCAKD